MMTLAAKLALALALAQSPTPDVSEAACGYYWNADSDGWWSCTVGLETWRCEAQGWCGGTVHRVMEAMPLPDPRFAGAVDWDAI